MNTCFVYDPKKLIAGSTMLRGFNIAKLLNWEVVSFNKEINNKKLIILKQVDYNKIVDLTGNNEVIIDMIDFEFPERKFNKSVFCNFDYGIFACKKQMEIYMEGFKYPEKCRVIYHHWDKKLENLKVTKLYETKIGYFGASAKCHLYKQFKDIDYFTMPISTEKHFDNILNEYVNYCVHYIIKPKKSERQYGSLLKLSTAAALGCPVIALRPANEELLGEGYPFYCESFAHDDILKVIEDMKMSFGMERWNIHFKDRKWHNALKIMKEVKEKTKIEVISKLYLELP